MKHQLVGVSAVALLLLTSINGESRRFDGNAHQSAGSQPCPVTLPNASQPPTKVLSGPWMHGNGKLWVNLSPDGIWWIKPSRNGSLITKFAWWREVPGPLTLQGHRLDKPHESFHSASVSGYGGYGFTPSEAKFSSAGCWEITGKVNDAALTFVLDVRIRNESLAGLVQ